MQSKEGAKGFRKFTLVLLLLMAFVLQTVSMAVPVMASVPTILNVNTSQTFMAPEDSVFTYFVLANDTDLQYPLNFTYTVQAFLSFNMTNYNDTAGLINFTPNNGEVGSYTFDFVVRDTGLESAAVTIRFNITNVNDPPNITSYYPSNLSLTATENVSSQVFNYTASDPDLPYGDNLSSKWIVDGIINLQNSSNFTYAPTFCDSGLHNITLNVSDENNSYSTVNWSINVTNTNRPPVFNTSKSLPNASWLEDNNLLNNFSLRDYFYDNDSIECNGSNMDTINFTASENVNATVVINQTSGNVSFYPLANWSGIEYVVFTGNDSLASSDSNTIKLNVTNVNDPPYLSITLDITWAIGFPYSEQVTGTDADTPYGDSLAYSYALNNSFPNFNMNSAGYVNFTPALADIGSHSINISTGDISGSNYTALRFFTIIQNTPPRLPTISNQTATENVPFNLTVNASDENYDTLNFSTNYSRFTIASYNASSKSFVFTPSNLDVGNHTINITVTDVYGQSNHSIFMLSIADVNNAPVLTNITSQLAKINQSFVFYVNATDADNNTINFTTNSSLFSISLLGQYGNGLVNFTPNISQTGNYSINVTARDSQNETGTVIFNLTVTENRPPLLAQPANSTATTGINFEINITATDPDFDSINITVNYSRLTARIINATTISFSFMPNINDQANHTILAVVNDTNGASSNTTFMLNISKVNHAPFFVTFANKTCTFDMACIFNITGYDTDGDILAYTTLPSMFSLNIVNTTVNSTTVRLNFTPTNSSRVNYSINITADDGTTTNFTGFYVFINLPPVIASYSPSLPGQTVYENSSLPFNQTSSDPEGSSVSYSWRLALENSTLVSNCKTATGTNQSNCESNSLCVWQSAASACVPANRYGVYTVQTTDQNYTYSSDYLDAGNYSLILLVFDDYLANASVWWNITVNDVNRAPIYGKKIHDTASNFSGGIFNNTNLSEAGAVRLEANGADYADSGIFTSTALDFGEAASEMALTNYYWNGTLPANTSITFETITSPTTDFSSSSWSNSESSNYSSILSSTERYLKYRLTLDTQVVSVTPNLSKVELGFTISNKTWAKNTVLLNWIDLDNYFYDADSDNLVNATVSGNSDITVEIDQSTKRVNLRPTNDFAGAELIRFSFSDGKSNVTSNYIRLTVISNESETSETQTPTPSSGGGGGGGAATVTQTETEESTNNQDSNKELLNFQLLWPSVPVYYANGTVQTNIRVVNGATEPLYGINIGAETDNRDVNITLSKDYIQGLAVGQEEIISMSLSTEKLYGTFEVVIVGKVNQPKFEDNVKIIIGSLEKGEYNKSQLNTKIGFVRDLLNENPECLELNELLENANREIASGNNERATLILDSAIESCKYLITRKGESIEKKSPIQLVMAQLSNLIKTPFVYVTLLAVGFSLLAIMAYYIYKRPKISEKKEET